MTYSEAQAALTKYEYITGSEYRGQEVSALLIVPKTGANIAVFAQQIVSDRISPELLRPHADLTIVALLDLDEWFVGGLLQWAHLQDVLTYLEDNQS